ncbi:flagellar biosynthesis protein FlaG [Vibrio sp. 10N.286.49.B3]|uniref:flagellar protein FlaG n=1 Tax=Vibrio sp. 10N.286.49.B3 TaxID=1880855 RepID=UPI000C8497F3|nr:flagellar protein FlaG [Vibrio sp. 10N.286.49.B3]PMH41049.1 flagellar biosynthesis protein FlaG [Vibrio sp. 10N.286.49.B3]
MDISSYASNTQPYGSPSGIKIAKENSSDATNISLSKGYAPPSEVKKAHESSLDSVMAFAQHRDEMNEDERVKLIDKMNDFISSMSKGVAFKLDDDSGRNVVTVYETTTGEIIRQIPDEEMLEILRRLATLTSNTGLIEEKV